MALCREHPKPFRLLDITPRALAPLAEQTTPPPCDQPRHDDDLRVRASGAIHHHASGGAAAIFPGFKRLRRVWRVLGGIRDPSFGPGDVGDGAVGPKWSLWRGHRVRVRFLPGSIYAQCNTIVVAYVCGVKAGKMLWSLV